MLNIIKDKTFTANDKQLAIQQLGCDICNSKYIKLRKRYGNGKFINIASNIDFDSSQCPVCNNHKYDVEDTTKDYNEMIKIIRDTETNNTSTQIRCKQYTGKQPTALWNIAYEIGKNGVNRFNNYQFMVSRYALKCSRCSYVKIIDEDDLSSIDKIVCNSCKYLLSVEATRKHDEILNKFKADIAEMIKLDNEFKNKKEDESTKEDIVEAEQKEASAFTKMKQRFGKYNPNMELLTAYKEDKLEKSVICCKLCGTPKEISSHRIKDLKNYECLGCKEQIENPNYLGLYRRDLTNTTKNGLVCKKQDGDRVTLVCKYCGTLHKDKDKIKFLLGKIYCNRKDVCSSVLVECEKCRYSMEIKNKDILTLGADNITCKNCGENLYIEARNEIIGTDASIEFKEGLRYFSSQIKKPIKFNNGIARTAEPLYRGTDGLDYYNCRCAEHNQNCILNEDEMLNTPHKYCNNIHNIFVDELEIKNLKLNREASVAERKDKK
ncbi:MAG: hypothetical protein J6A59_10870 [Lachnospiraceae bacterium]|nr:hypothetical protein [Lachnospiraceae bacterium]